MALVVGLGVVVVSFPDGATASLAVVILSGVTIAVFRNQIEDKEFITKIFVLALIARLGFGVFIHAFDLRAFFGGDAMTYDFFGNRLVEYWMGQASPDEYFTRNAIRTTGPGWGMNYFVGTIYFALGRNIFAAQSICGVIGAATVPMVYMCAHKIFHNTRVARMSAISIALFPSFIIWSSQLLKDGLIIFLLVLVMGLILRVQERFSYVTLVGLVLALFGIMSLRFYIFYMVLVAVVGSFLIGTSSSIASMARRAIALVIIGLGLTYFGVIRTASIDLERFGNLEAVQRSRSDLATAQSGFASDADVSTADGAIETIPVGVLFLMLAPFPWQVANVRQAITLPDVLLWWAFLPVMISGLVYSLRHRLRRALPIIIFSVTLTLAYSIFQGNVGTAYRQRTQIQVFLFMFIAVGWTLFKEKRENAVIVNRKNREMSQYRLRAQ